MKVSGELHAAAALSLGRVLATYWLTLGRPQSRSGSYARETKLDVARNRTAAIQNVAYRHD
jgi:hypothetical protein